MIMVLIIMLVTVAALAMSIMMCVLYVVICCFRCRICLEWATLLEDISSRYMTIGDW